MLKLLQKFHSKRLAAYITTGVCLFSLSLGALAKDVTIAVLAPYGESYTYKAWQPTIDFLQQRLPEYKFKLIAIEPSQVERLHKMVDNQQVDFSIVQPITYAELHLRHNATAILSMVGSSKFSKFGSVIFSRNDSNITSLNHIKGKTIGAATPKGLGGWLIGQYAINEYNKDLINSKNIRFLGVQDNIVNAVSIGSVDIGIVRTGTLERMASENKLELSNFNILNQQYIKDFPYLLSTQLYPEWAVVQSSHTSKELSKKISTSLLNMKSGSKEAVSGSYWEWMPPLDYHSVLDLMKELGVGTFKGYEEHGNHLFHLIKENQVISLSSLILFISFLFLIIRVLILNKKLKNVNFYIAKQNEMILNSVSEGIYGVDLDGNCTFINKSLTRILGWSESDLIGNHQHEIMHHTYIDGTPHPSSECPVYATFQDGMRKFIDEDMFWKKNGEGIYVEYSSNPIVEDSGTILGSVVVFRDITEQRKNEDYMQEVERSSRLNVMGEMVTEIAHELNQPLTTIATNSFAISKMIKSQNNKENSKFIEVLNVISKQADHAANVIRHLRKISKKDQDEYIDMNINKNIQNSITLLGGLFKSHNIKLDLNLSPDIPNIKIQPVQIDQVIINLCKNAVDAMGSVGKNSRNLTIESYFEDDNIIVNISDSGPGIDDPSELFNAFSTGKKDGMGIGLSISRSIIERYAGNLILKETSPDGSKFSFTLPKKLG